MNKLQKSKRDAEESRFAEHLGGFFHDVLRAAGVTMTATHSMERVRSIGEKMGRTIGDHAEKKAVQVIKRLQNSVIDGFDKTEEAFDKMKALQASTSLALLHVIKDLESQDADVKDLQARLQRVENMISVDFHKPTNMDN